MISDLLGFIAVISIKSFLHIKLLHRIRAYLKKRFIKFIPIKFISINTTNKIFVRYCMLYYSDAFIKKNSKKNLQI